MKRLKQQVRRLRAENARLKSQLGKGKKQRKKVAKTAPKWSSLIGRGKEIWQNLDVDAFIDAERNSWN